MRSLSLRLLLSLCALMTAPALLAHDVTISGTQNFSSLDGSALDHDGAANGVFTVNDGNLIVNGTINCNDDGASSNSACAMAFNVSGDMTVNTGGAIYAENRSGPGSGGAIALTVGGALTLNGTAIISSASKTNSGGAGGAITANIFGGLTVGAGSTIDAGSGGGTGGTINITAGGAATVNGNVLSGPSRTIQATRLTGEILDGGNGNQRGGQITIRSTTFAEPAMVVGATAIIASQGQKNGAGPVTIEGCGVEIRGLVAAVAADDAAATVAIRSGKALLVDGRDLGGVGTRQARLRADALSDGANDDGVDLFAAGDISLLGPATGTLFVASSQPGPKNKKDGAGTIRVISTGGAATLAGKAAIAGVDGKGTRGGTISVASKNDATLDTATLIAIGDYSKPKKQSAGGQIIVRSYSGSVYWRNGIGDVRPIGSDADVPPADQGKIILTACGTVDTTGSSYPSNGVPTSVFPETHTLVCSPSAPSLPVGVPPLGACNTPPVANPASASTNEDQSVVIHLSGSDADGDSLTFTIVSGPSHGSLGAVISTGPTTADVTYSPALNYNGSDSFVFRADDGNGGTDDETANITVAPVNDPPSFLAGPTITVLEDAGAQTFANWATSISPGPADESGQTVTFTVTNDNNALFSVQPALASNGTLTFTAAPNAYGSATITIVAHDNGGTANGGNDTSAPQTSSITVTAVNDAPSFTAGGNVTVNEDSGAYSAAWATGISAGPNESAQSVAFHVSNDNNALFTAQPSISPSGVLTFTPAADAFGTATVSVYLQDDGGTANGGVDTSATVTFTITVNSVNDAPSFTSGGNVTVNEDSGAYSAPWATSISAGPANESGQTLTFLVSNDNNSLFSVQPSIAPNGVLTFTPAANAFGTATVTVSLQDDGGTANGGVDTSPAQTFTITVNSVNDAPSFTPGGNVTVGEDSGPYSAAWATAISAGANEGGQTVHFNVSNNNNALFSAQPSISPTGVLTFTPAPNAFGTATVTVTLQDDGGTANGGVDTSAPVTFTITVSCINDGPVAGNDSFTGFGNTELRVDLAANTTPTVVRTTPSGRGVLHNDSDPVEGDPFSITSVVGCADGTAPFDCTFASGTLSLNANGTFSFMPNVGTTSVTFQYVITDQPSCGAPATATGTVTLTFNEVIWYVNGSAAAGGNGTSVAPFNSFASLNGPGGVGDVDAAGHYIFVHDSTVSGGIGLEPSQHLIGEGVGLTISSYTLVPAGNKAKILAAGDAVTVNNVTGVEIAGLDLSSAAGNGIDVSSAGLTGAGASIHDNVISAAALEGIDVNAGSMAGTSAIIANTSITSAGNGLDVVTSGATSVASVAYSNGTITSTGGTGIRMDGSAGGNLSVTGLSNVTVDGNTAGDGINLLSVKFDAIPGGSFDAVSGGTIAVGTSGNPVGGAGVLMTNVSGDYAIGSLSAFPGTGAGVSIAGSGLFTGAAGMRITNGGGAINTPAGVGLSVTDATIGAANMQFTSISATGGANGIFLKNTDTAGGLKVNGTGPAGSGGTIANLSGADGSTGGIGVYLESTAQVSLTTMQLNNFSNFAIRGLNVAGFTLANSTINGANGTNDAFDEGSVSFTNLTGTASVSGSSISGGLEDNFDVRNSSGSLNRLTITSSTIGLNSTALGSDGVYLEASGSAVLNATVQSSNFLGARSDLLQTNVLGNAALDLVLTGNTFANAHTNIAAGGGGVSLTGGGTGSNVNFTFNVSGGNTFRDALGPALLVFHAGGAGTFSGRIDGNSIGVAAIANSGSRQASGIQIESSGGGDMSVTVNSNVVRQYNNHGILLQAGDTLGNPLIYNVSVTNNTVANPGNLASSFNGIHLNNGTTAVDNFTSCVDIRNNAITGSGNAVTDFRVRQRQSTTVRLPGYGGANNDNAAVVSFISGNNGGASGTANNTVPTGGGFIGGAACPTP